MSKKAKLKGKTKTKGKNSSFRRIFPHLRDQVMLKQKAKKTKKKHLTISVIPEATCETRLKSLYGGGRGVLPQKPFKGLKMSRLKLLEGTKENTVPIGYSDLGYSGRAGYSSTPIELGALALHK